jgi:hypothetical protein
LDFQHLWAQKDSKSLPYNQLHNKHNHHVYQAIGQ